MKIVEFNIGKNNVRAVGYLHEVPSTPVLGHSIRPCVLILPGGAYRFTSPRESEPVALSYLNAGFQAFILHYSCEDAIKTESPVNEAFMTIDYIKKHAAEFYIDKDKIVVTGFSAGGHLAAAVAIFHGEYEKTGLDCKCRAAVLCYPVISTKEGITHELSAFNISEGNDRELRLKYSLENRVDENTLPTFIWHTRWDKAVSVENTLRFIGALSKHGVEFEAHIFKDGEHGSSLCNKEVNTPVENTVIWFDLALAWLCSILDYKI